METTLVVLIILLAALWLGKSMFRSSSNRGACTGCGKPCSQDCVALHQRPTALAETANASRDG